MKRSMIVAASENGVIGAAGQIPWKLRGDLKRFKELTMGHHIIMGRKTYESIGRPLPGRTTVVVSRREMNYPAGVYAVSSVADAFSVAAQAGDQEPFVCGGGEVYRAAMSLCDRIYLTVVQKLVDGDATFPLEVFVDGNWHRVESKQCDAEDGLESRFEIWERA